MKLQVQEQSAAFETQTGGRQHWPTLHELVRLHGSKGSGLDALAAGICCTQGIDALAWVCVAAGEREGSGHPGGLTSGHGCEARGSAQHQETLCSCLLGELTEIIIKVYTLEVRSTSRETPSNRRSIELLDKGRWYWLWSHWRKGRSKHLLQPSSLPCSTI